jgi:Tol biopolymer transport system component
LSARQSLREVPLRGTTTSPVGRWLTRGNSQDRQPAYSPDGEWVVFSSDRSGSLDLWRISTKTGEVRRITDDPADDWDPAYTPDGKSIIWSSNRTGHFEIWIANADGSAARQLTKHGTDSENPTATRDGWVVYAYADPAGKSGIGKIRLNGSDATRLVAGFGPPEVSPDGQYAAQPSLNGLRVVRIADGAVLPFQIQGAFRCRWMPDGRAIVFTANDEKAIVGVFVQDFIPGQDTRKTRRHLAGFDPDLQTESFGISPDSSRITISSAEYIGSVMIAEHVPGVWPPVRRMR